MGSSEESNGWGKAARGVVMKTAAAAAGALLLKRFTRSAPRSPWDHSGFVSLSLSGEKFSREQASRDPDNYFNIRLLTCPAAEMVDGSKVLYMEQVGLLENSPQTLPAGISVRLLEFRDPFLFALFLLVYRMGLFSLWFQRFWLVKPCPKDHKCDFEVSSYAIRNMEEYKNFCDRPKDQRPLPEEVITDISENMSTVLLKLCERGKRCLYEGSTPPGGFPNSWNGAAFCTSELTVLKNSEIHIWDRGYDDNGQQVWGPKGGPYEFKPAPASSLSHLFPLNFPPLQAMDKNLEGSYLLQE